MVDGSVAPAPTFVTSSTSGSDNVKCALLAITIHHTCPKVIEKNIARIFVPLFSGHILPQLYTYLIRIRSRPVFHDSSSDTGSEQNVPAAPDPAPSKMGRLRRF